MGRLEHRYLELGLLIVTILKPRFPCLTALMDRDNADDCRDGAVDACDEIFVRV